MDRGFAVVAVLALPGVTPADASAAKPAASGCATSRSALPCAWAAAHGGRYRATFLREFDSLTAENEMKMRGTQPRRGTYDFAAADELVRFAAATARPCAGTRSSGVSAAVWRSTTRAGQDRAAPAADRPADAAGPLAGSSQTTSCSPAGAATSCWPS